MVRLRNCRFSGLKRVLSGGVRCGRRTRARSAGRRAGRLNVFHKYFRRTPRCDGRTAETMRGKPRTPGRKAVWAIRSPRSRMLFVWIPDVNAGSIGFGLNRAAGAITRGLPSGSPPDTASEPPRRPAQSRRQRFRLPDPLPRGTRTREIRRFTGLTHLEYRNLIHC